jgi:hypothetical protein
MITLKSYHERVPASQCASGGYHPPGMIPGSSATQ